MLRHRNEFPVEGELPAFDGATAWLNSAPLTPADLRGRVVLVSFGTYTCINWIRSLPYVRAWADKYAGRRAGGRRRADARVRLRGRPRQRGPRDQGDGRPLPGRGRQRLRRLAGVRQPLLARAVLRRRPRVGSGTTTSARASTRNPRWSSRCSCARPVPTSIRASCDIEPHGVEARGRLGQPGVAGDLRRLRTRRRLRLARRRRCRTSATSTRRRPSCGATSGRCRATGRSAPCLRGSSEPGGSISYQFHARDLHLVMGPPAGRPPVRFRVRLDGEPPGPAHGIDVDEHGNGTADYQRMYQLIRQPRADRRPAVRDRVPRRRRRGLRVHLRMTAKEP